MEKGNVIQNAIDYIEEHLLEDLTYDQIAGKAFMSSYYFQKIFSIVCGLTLGEYIRYRRLSLAAEEIKTTDEKIIDIALKYGYDTPEGFSRAFSRFHGISPMMARHHGEVKTFAKITVQSILKGMKAVEEKIKERGYLVGNVGAVYLTGDMEKTAKWFEDVLGWYAGVEKTDAAGNPTYGCAMPFNGELVHLGITTFNGLFLLPGQTPQCLLAMMGVKNIDNLYAYVKKNGWNDISDVTLQSWGARSCDIVTVDGCILRFFE